MGGAALRSESTMDRRIRKSRTVGGKEVNSIKLALLAFVSVPAVLRETLARRIRHRHSNLTWHHPGTVIHGSRRQQKLTCTVTIPIR
jgi:hypothetical protein